MLLKMRRRASVLSIKERRPAPLARSQASLLMGTRLSLQAAEGWSLQIGKNWQAGYGTSPHRPKEILLNMTMMKSGIITGLPMFRPPWELPRWRDYLSL